MDALGDGWEDDELEGSDVDEDADGEVELDQKAAGPPPLTPVEAARAVERYHAGGEGLEAR